MKRDKKKCISLLLTGALVVSSMCVPFFSTESKAESDYGLSNPVIQKQVVVSGGDSADRVGNVSEPLVKADTVTWDCITFGSYWQEDTNGDGKVNQSDDKQPIKWRVLSVNGDDAFLLADQSLDAKPYNTLNEATTWETCTLRKWLNQDFMDVAFSADEKAAIKDTTLTNEDNTEYNVDGGNNTTDKVFILSMSDLTTEAYGFPADFVATSDTKLSKTTSYCCNINSSMSPSGLGEDWWVRTPGGLGSNFAMYINWKSLGSDLGGSVSITNNGVRPAMHINLSSRIWKEAQAVRVYDNETSTWDNVTFGNYWQEDTNGDGAADQNDEKQPITWKVLAIDEEDVLLLADKNLDCQPFHSERMDMTWENSSLRKWLNEDFMNAAFSVEEQGLICESNLVNSDNELYKTEGGNNTTDKVFLLSIDEVSNLSYGFEDEYFYTDKSKNRVTKNTSYAAVKASNAKWWLRSPGKKAYLMTYIGDDGYSALEGWEVEYAKVAVRPALRIKRSYLMPTPTPTVAPTPTAEPTEAPTTEPTDAPVAPTQSPTPTVVPTTPVAPTAPATVTATPEPTESVEATKTPEATVTEQPSISETSTPSTTITVGKVKLKSVKNKKGKKLIVKWKKVSGANGYQYKYALDKKFKKKMKKKLVSAKKKSVTIKGLKKKKTYYVRVRAYKKINGEKVFGKWSKVGKAKIRK